MGGCSSDLLLPDDLFAVDDHPDALVEPRRTGGVLGVDAEADPALPAPMELAEAVQQERLCQAASAPRRPNADSADPTTAGALGIVAGAGHDVLAGTHEKPEGRIVIRLRDLPFPPLLERLRLVFPMLGERFLERAVERAREVRRERLDPKAFRELWRARRIV